MAYHAGFPSSLEHWNQNSMDGCGLKGDGRASALLSQINIIAIVYRRPDGLSRKVTDVEHHQTNVGGVEFS
jgi:hypothetical protein